MAKLTIYLPDEMFKKLKEFQLPMSGLVQLMIKFYFEHRNDVDKKDDDK